MQRHDYSVPACVVGLILGGKVEDALLQTYQISGGGQLSYFLGRPIAMVLLALLLFSLFSRPIMQWWRRQACDRRRRGAGQRRQINLEEMPMTRATESSIPPARKLRRAQSQIDRADARFCGCCGRGIGKPVTARRKALAAAPWPTEPITIIVSTKAGGGFDTMARNLAPALSHELGVPVNVLDKEGGAMVIGTKYFLSQPHDGNTLLVIGAGALLVCRHQQISCRLRSEGFRHSERAMDRQDRSLRPNGGRFQSFKAIIDAIKAHPGEVSCGVVRDSGEFFNAGILMNALKLPLSAIRLVTYEASAPLRTAVAGSQLDFAHGVAGSEPRACSA